MTRTLAVVTLLFAAAVASADGKLTLKVEESDPPKDLSDAVKVRGEVRTGPVPEM